VTGQTITDRKYIQIDGIVYDEQGNPLSNISIMSMALRKGATSRNSGIYSVISTPGDTVIFTAMGFKNTLLPIPSDFEGTRYLKDVFLEYDTISIHDVLVLPWGSYAEFKKAVVETDFHDYEVENMTENLVLLQKQIIESSGLSPEAAYRHVARQYTNAAYTRNQFPENNLLNPFAWSKFIKGLREGLLKNERKR
jgi:hypothetical protein